MKPNSSDFMRRPKKWLCLLLKFALIINFSVAFSENLKFKYYILEAYRKRQKKTSLLAIFTLIQNLATNVLKKYGYSKKYLCSAKKNNDAFFLTRGIRQYLTPAMFSK
jgi:hypothetical protein